ncbi:MAG TPA: putative DNA-binding domain-containing protein [Myxococcota bacterium]|nr:putative DNA-binding domain-containing protein [Myxococcota bacterium]HND28605.1 putative DNA-binding domain-containing protein [Myxococcota bacterium]HNH45877.1 putative DNA-binding domain-containing protein [Myxococcota bacterium]
MSLPEHWQAQMVAMISGAVPADPAWFRGSDALDPMEMIGVYREQYRLRIYDALAEDVPGLLHLLGDQAERVLWNYLEATPPSSWTLNHIHQKLADWLETAGAPAEQVDMARLEWAVAEAFEAAAGSPLSPADLGELPPLQLAPPVRLLRLRHNVHHLRSALLLGGELPALQAGDFPVVVFRRGHRVRHRDVAPELYQLLLGIVEGRLLEDALERAVAVDPERLVPQIGGWFTLAGEAGWLQRCRRGQSE